MKNTKSFDVVSLGEILIDFTFQGYNEDGQKLFAQNAGGAPANVLVAVQRLGGKTAFIGKVGNDMHGKFLLDVLNAENINTDSTIVDDRYFTTLAFVSINKNGERSFSFARKPGADTKLSKSEIKTEILNSAQIFHVGSLSLTNEPSREATFFAVKKAKASEPRNWRVMVLPIERTVSFTVNVAFSVSSSPSAMKKKKRGRRRGVVRSSKVFISSITIPSGIESLYPIAS